MTVMTSLHTIQIFDRPMCCSTGVCGPQIDPILLIFAADLDWLQSQGITVERFNLAQQPGAFVENKAVHERLTEKGTDCLPLIYVNGSLASEKEYPTRATLGRWMGLTGMAATSFALPVISNEGCCSQPGCC